MSDDPQAGPQEGGDSTDSVPGYQPTERLDRASLRSIAAGIDPAEDEPIEDDPGLIDPRTGEVIEQETVLIARRLPRPVHREPTPLRSVTIVDLPVYRLRRPGDLVSAVIVAVSILVVLLMAVFAQHTTEGVTEDVQAALPTALRNLLLGAVNVLEGITIFILPLVISAVRLARRQVRAVLEATATAAIAVAVTWGAIWLLDTWGTPQLVNGVTASDVDRLSFIPIMAALAAFLTVIGAPDRRRLVRWTWYLLWLTLALQILRSGMTLPGGLTSILIGYGLGLLARYTSGVLGDRAYSADLVHAMRRCGIDPERVLRLVDGQPVEGASVETVLGEGPIGFATSGESHEAHPHQTQEPTAPDQETPAASSGSPSPSSETPETSGTQTRDPRALVAAWEVSMQLPVIDAPIIPPASRTGDPAPTPGAERVTESSPSETATSGTTTPEPGTAPSGGRIPVRRATAVIGEDEGENRIYSVRDADGQYWDVGVLDGDRQVVGMLETIWATARLRGLRHRTAVSLQASAERAALLTYAVRAAGVHAPELRGMTIEADSAVLVSEHVSGTLTLDDVDATRLSDTVLDRIWRELLTAHAAGIAHRSLDARAILLNAEGHIWLTNWSQGEVSSPSLARRLDQAHLLALLALRVGAERAMASATRNLTSEDLRAIAPILQPVALPERTRAAARRNKKEVKKLQELLLAVLPTGEDVEQIALRRFSARTIVTVTVAVVVGWIVLTSFNLPQMVSYVQEANPWYLVAGFALGLSTYVGSALGLVAFSPVRLGVWRTTLVQIAASIVGLVAPAGVGPAAMNLRFLQKNKLDTPMAVATVALVQVSQFVTTILLLLAVALLTGSSGALDQLPSGTVLIVAGSIAAVIGVALAVPRVRRWVIKISAPTLKQVWPRLVWVVGQPHRLLLGIGGNVVMTAGYVAAFGVTLLAFDQTLPITSLAIIYLAGNAAGSAVPTPGGIGAVELALTSGLTAAGITASVALSAAFVFRLLTFWGRVPLGWLALRYLQKRNLV